MELRVSAHVDGQDAPSPVEPVVVDDGPRAGPFQVAPQLVAPLCADLPFSPKPRIALGQVVAGAPAASVQLARARREVADWHCDCSQPSCAFCLFPDTHVHPLLPQGARCRRHRLLLPHIVAHPVNLDRYYAQRNPFDRLPEGVSTCHFLPCLPERLTSYIYLKPPERSSRSFPPSGRAASAPRAEERPRRRLPSRCA